VETAPECPVWSATCRTKSQGAKLSAGNGPAPIPLDESGRASKKNKPIMTYRTCQNIVLIGSFFMLLDILFLPPLVEKWGALDRVDRLPQLNTPTVAAATIVKVWAYKKTGLYYCPDSKLYGKLKPGVYMTQEEALGRGYRPAGQDPCR
jgi:hypothetical protein